MFLRQSLIKERAFDLKVFCSMLINDNNLMKLLKPLLVNSIFLNSFNILQKVSSIIFFVVGFWYTSIKKLKQLSLKELLLSFKIFSNMKEK